MFSAPGRVFAQENAEIKQPASDIVTGEVYFVALRHPQDGLPERISILDDQGRRFRFIVTYKTVILDKEARPIVLGAIKEGEKVSVEYKLDDAGSYVATAITLK